MTQSSRYGKNKRSRSRAATHIIRPGQRRREHGTPHQRHSQGTGEARRRRASGVSACSSDQVQAQAIRTVLTQFQSHMAVRLVNRPQQTRATRIRPQRKRRTMMRPFDTIRLQSSGSRFCRESRFCRKPGSASNPQFQSILSSVLHISECSDRTSHRFTRCLR